MNYNPRLVFIAYGRLEEAADVDSHGTRSPGPRYTEGILASRLLLTLKTGGCRPFQRLRTSECLGSSESSSIRRRIHARETRTHGPADGCRIGGRGRVHDDGQTRAQRADGSQIEVEDRGECHAESNSTAPRYRTWHYGGFAARRRREMYVMYASGRLYKRQRL